MRFNSTVGPRNVAIRFLVTEDEAAFLHVFSASKHLTTAALIRAALENYSPELAFLNQDANYARHATTKARTEAQALAKTRDRLIARVVEQHPEFIETLL